MQFSSFITNKIIKKLIEWDPELWWVDILHNSNFNFFKDLQNLLNSYKNHIDIIFYRNDEQIYFIEHGTENPCHTFRVDDSLSISYMSFIKEFLSQINRI